MLAKDERFTFLLVGPEMDHIGPGSLCYTLPVFPPPKDFPMMVDTSGKIVCTYGDNKWLLGPATLNFGTDPGDWRTRLSLSSVNGELLKRCICWFMYGDRRNIKINTILGYHTLLKSVFAFCSGLPKPIAASDLHRHISTLEEPLAEAIRPSAAKSTCELLQEMWLVRDVLGFTLLSPDQIARVRQLIPQHDNQQTPFIPPRIWAYQAARLKTFLQDFIEHKTQFVAALLEIQGAYRDNYGTLASSRRMNVRRNPCSMNGPPIRGCTYLGSFSSFAEKHGIRDVIGRWILGSNIQWEDLRPQEASIRLLTQYLNSVGLVGMAYMECFSGMRLGEAMSLRCDCLSIEKDTLLGDVHILNGETSKTTQDDDARWLAAPSVKLAVEAMATVARWRIGIATERGDINVAATDRTNPYLVQRSYEPWANGSGSFGMRRPSLRPDGFDVGHWRRRVPRLFDDEALRVTADDESYVRRFCANADMSKFGIGCVWHLTSHQYRRTAAVMMGASQVSLVAQQYQLKHLTRNQSAYYRRGFQSLRLNRNFSRELVTTRFELVSLEFGLINGPEYVSPISSARKEQILRFHEVATGDALQRAIKKGQLAVKQTLFGVCTRRDSCPYGGHDNYAHCPECNDALLSKRKRAGVEQLGKTIAVRLVDAPVGTPLRNQLERNAEAIERFMHATA